MFFLYMHEKDTHTLTHTQKREREQTHLCYDVLNEVKEKFWESVLFCHLVGSGDRSYLVRSLPEFFFPVEPSTRLSSLTTIILCFGSKIPQGYSGLN